MKKKLIILITLIMVMFSPVSIVKAENKENKANELENGLAVYSDSFTPENALLIAYDGQNKEGDRQITKSIILEGVEYGKIQSEKNGESKSGYEEWTLISQEVLRSYGVIKGHYLRKVSAGMNYGSTTVSFNVSGTIHGITLSATATFSVSVAYSGPSGTELICS